MADRLQAFVGTVLAANAALVLAVCLLAVATVALKSAGFERDWTLRRRMTGIAWMLVLALPIALTGLPGNAWNATDMLVAQFLRGNLSNLSMTATDLSTLLSFRDELPRALVEPTNTFWKILAIILVTAAILRTIYVARSALRLRGIIHDAGTIRRIGRVRVAVSDTCPVPFAARGLRHHHVVLPSNLLAQPEAFRIALSHELQHIRQGDPLREVLVALVSPIFVVNPAFWALARQTRRLREHDCDAACIARPAINPRAYSLCLLDVARGAGHVPSRTPGAFSVALLGRRQLTGRATRSQLGRRIEIIAAGPARSANGILTAALLVLFAAVLCGATWTLRPPADWSQERLMLSSVINLERLETINTLSQRPLR